MRILLFVFLLILQILTVTCQNVNRREKRQGGGFQPPGHAIPRFCRGNRRNRPECVQYFQGQGASAAQQGKPPKNNMCRGNRKKTPECQALIAAGGGGNRGPPFCRGRNKHLPQCQNQWGGQQICFGSNCNNQGTQPLVSGDNAIEEAFKQIPWLTQISSDKQHVSFPGLNQPKSSVQSRFYQLAHGVGNQAFHRCLTPQFEFGHCRYLQYCVLPEFAHDFYAFLDYVCIIDGTYVGVCCPDTHFPNQAAPPPPTTTTTRRPSTPPSARGSCGLSSKQQTKIVGGRDSELNKFPWAAALLRNNNSQYCGGVLITDQHVLTASHCVDGFDTSTVVVRLGEYSFGQHNESPHKDFKLSNIRKHENYNTGTYENDIAILTLERSTELNFSIWPICLPPANELFTGKTATVIGWGTIYFGGPVSPILQEASVPVWDNADCDAAYKDNKVFPLMLCAGDKDGGKDSCQGDSGGPLMLQNGPQRRWAVIGIVSWGIRCADPGLPGVYARVSMFLDWIEKHTA